MLNWSPTRWSLLDDQPNRVFVHPFPVELLRFLQLQPQVEQAEGRDDTQTQSHTPRSTEVVLSEDQNQDHGDQVRDDETGVDLEVGEHDEPAVAMALLELAGALCGRD